MSDFVGMELAGSATSACARAMSAETTSWKTGISQASVSRRAIVRRMLVSVTLLDLAGRHGCGRRRRAGAGAAALDVLGDDAPSGPVPASDERSMPRSRAIRRASGDALSARPLSAAPAGAGAGSSLGCGRPRQSRSPARRLRGPAAAATVPFAGSPGPSSPCSPMNAIVVPTGTSPSATAILSRTPDGLGLDLLRDLLRVELVERLALLDRVALGLQPPDDRARLHALAEPRELDLSRHFSRPSRIAVQHVGGVRDDELLHHRRERERRELRAHALHRSVEPVEGLVLDDGRDLGAEAHALDGLVRDDAAVRLLHRLDDRLLVERLQRPRVDDLDRDTLLLRLLGRLERLVDEPAGGDDRHVLALAMHARLAERDRLELVGHLFLDAGTACGARRRRPGCRRRSTTRAGRARPWASRGRRPSGPECARTTPRPAGRAARPATSPRRPACARSAAPSAGRPTCTGASRPG